MNPEKKNAVGYIRWSTEDQSEGTTAEIQMEAIEKHCRDHGYTLLEIYRDEGISGFTTSKRTAFLKMKQDAKEGKYQYLIIFKLDRFGRNLKEILINYDDFEALGIKLISLKENLDTSTSPGRAYRNMMGTFAELERDTIKERMQGGRTKKWKEGRTFIGKAAYGYTWNKEKKIIEVNPEEAAIYRHIVDLYLHEGLSDVNIALRLREEGIKFRGRKYPATQTIGYMLTNPIYYGVLIANQHEYDGDHRIYEKGKKGAKKKPADQHIIVKVPPLISKTTWDAIQAKRQSNKSKGKHVTIAHEYFLRDSLICGECGGKVIARTNFRPRKDGTRFRMYACYSHQTTAKRLEVMGRKRCDLPVINAEALETMVWDEIMRTLTLGGYHLKGKYTPSDLETLIDAGKFDEEITRLEAANNNLENELKTKERAKGRLLSLLEDEDFNQEDFRLRLFQVNEEITTIKAKIVDNDEKIKTLKENRDSQQELLKFIQGNRDWLAKLVEELTNLPPEDKKVIVESLIPEKITVYKGWEPGEPPISINFRIFFNKTIFDRLASEGKITYLNLNGRSHDGSPAGDAGRLPTGRWPRPGNPAPRRKGPPPGAARAGPNCRQIPD
ncbi:MAG: recombinase family protein [Thermodesulfobacteriota bacterium]